jgi:hypothetical protein
MTTEDDLCTDARSEQVERTSEQVAPAIGEQLAELLALVRVLGTDLGTLAEQQRLHGQLLVAQAQVLAEVQRLLATFGPVLEKWQASPGARLAGFLGGKQQTEVQRS